ncbi:MAG: hypothetical protein ACLSAP_08560 [Oscillospiraceae bacterium]
MLNLLDRSLLVSADLRQIALIIILMRAGLNLDIRDLKKVGPAILMCFVPACFEIAGMVLVAPKLRASRVGRRHYGGRGRRGFPAVIVPKMLRLMENRYGTGKSIP